MVALKIRFAGSKYSSIIRDMCKTLEELKNEGRLEGIHESVLNLLRKGFLVLEVSNLLELTEEDILKTRRTAYRRYGIYCIWDRV